MYRARLEQLPGGHTGIWRYLGPASWWGRWMDVNWQIKTHQFILAVLPTLFCWIVVVSLDREFEWSDCNMRSFFFTPKVSGLRPRPMLQLRYNTQMIFLLQLSIPWSAIWQIENGPICQMFLCFVSTIYTYSSRARISWYLVILSFYCPAQRAGFSLLGFFRYCKRVIVRMPTR